MHPWMGQAGAEAEGGTTNRNMVAEAQVYSMNFHDGHLSESLEFTLVQGISHASVTFSLIEIMSHSMRRKIQQPGRA